MPPRRSQSATASHRIEPVARRAVSRGGPTSTPAPPSAAAAAKPCSSVRSSPTNTGRAPAKSGSVMNAFSASPLVAPIGRSSTTIAPRCSAKPRLPGQRRHERVGALGLAAAPADNGARSRPACSSTSRPGVGGGERLDRVAHVVEPERDAQRQPRAVGEPQLEPVRAGKGDAVQRQMALEVGERAPADDGQPPVEPALQPLEHRRQARPEPKSRRACRPARPGSRRNRGTARRCRAGRAAAAAGWS